MEQALSIDKSDIYATTTKKIIAAIEEGCPSWRQPWTGSEAGACLPLRSNGEPYRGINVLVLWGAAAAKGYTSAHWLTFIQAKNLGAHVRMGEKSTTIVKYGTFNKENKDGRETSVPYAKQYAVFNADQIDGLPAHYYSKPMPVQDLGTKPDPNLEALIAATGAVIDISAQPCAYYDRFTDRIHMPPIGTFHDAASYYGTLAHELTHWTGAVSRLDRFTRFSRSDAYAFEELVGEIGSCMICAALGLKPDFVQSGAYIQTWLQAMQEDNRVIFRAAREAQKAMEFVLALMAAKMAVAAQ